MSAKEHLSGRKRGTAEPRQGIRTVLSELEALATSTDPSIARSTKKSPTEPAGVVVGEITKRALAMQNQGL